MLPMAEIVVFGSIVQDLVSYTDRFPRPGETIKATFETAPGGKGANQAAQAAMLGSKVCLIGRVGKDIFGTINVDSLKACNVITHYIDVSERERTGCSTIIVTEDGENSIAVAPGANLQIPPSRIDELENVVASAKLVVCQNETAFESVKRMFELARKHNVRTFLNYAPVEKSFDKNILTLVDILCTNEAETEFLTDQKVKTVEEAMEGARKLLTYGPSIVIATLGAKGVIFGTKDGQSGHIAVPPVKAVETTGAGDSFCGALAYFLVKRPELELHEQIRRAAFIATCSVQRKGTRNSYPWPNELPAELLN